MKRIYISTVNRREAPGSLGESAGKVYVLDWETKELISDFSSMKINKTCYMQPGRSHGSRGITVHEDSLCIAGSNNTVGYYDLDTLELKKEIKFDAPKVKALHQIKDHDGYLYIVSTGTDRLLKVKDGETVEEIDLIGQAKELDKYISQLWKGTTHWPKDKLHFNSIGWDDNGDEYHLYFSAGVVYNYTKQEVAVQKDFLRGTHDLCFSDNYVYVSGSTARTVFKIDLKTGQEQRVFHVDDYDEMPKNRDKNEICHWGMLRGMVLYEDRVFVCRAPVKVFELLCNENRIELIDSLNLSSTYYESVYDIALDPRDW